MRVPAFGHRVAVLGIVACMALPAGAMTASAADDAVAGRALAQRWCTECHAVEATQASAQSDAPSFAAIARRTTEVSAGWLAFGLLEPHPPMPQIALSRTQARDLAAYLSSLRK